MPTLEELMEEAKTGEESGKEREAFRKMLEKLATEGVITWDNYNAWLYHYDVIIASTSAENREALEAGLRSIKEPTWGGLRMTPALTEDEIRQVGADWEATRPTKEELLKGSGLDVYLNLALDPDPTAITQFVTSHKVTTTKERQEYIEQAQLRMAPFLLQQEANRPWLEKAQRMGFQTVSEMSAFLAQQQREQAFAGAFLPPKPPPQGFQLPPIPSVEPEFKAFMETLPPNIQRFWAGREGEILDPIQGARLAWWGALHERKREEGEAEEEVGSAKREFRALMAGEEIVGGSRLEMVPGYGFGTQRLAEATAAKRTASRRRDEDIVSDPLAAYLQGFPFTEEFLKLAPRQRGEYPSRFAPPAVWRG